MSTLYITTQVISASAAQMTKTVMEQVVMKNAMAQDVMKKNGMALVEIMVKTALEEITVKKTELVEMKRGITLMKKN